MDQDDIRTKVTCSLSQCVAHFTAAVVADESHRINGFLSTAGAYNHADAAHWLLAAHDPPDGTEQFIRLAHAAGS